MALIRPSTRIALAAVLATGLLAAPAAQAQYQGFGKNKVQYRDFDWRIYHSTHFDVYYYTQEEDLLQKVVSFAESAYDQLSREFDRQIQEATPLIFYRTHSEFEQNNIIVGFIPEGLGAFASPARNRMVLPVDLPDPELMKLILHELTHIFQYHILFQGSLSKGATLRPPQWFTEGMASYMADDESAHDKMVLRDAVVNDRIPSVSSNAGGYFAYRFGHAVFEYIEERWGREGFLDFVYEVRNTIGARTERALQRTFRLAPEDFDHEFRRWLRKKYLRRLVETGEPGDFGRPFRSREAARGQEISPAAAPSGDLVAAFSAQRGDIDLVLFDARRRRQIRNLTKGYSSQYLYLAVQGAGVARKMGRDVTFSPDANQLAFFARRNQGRALFLADVLNGGIDRIIEMPSVDQQLAPTWSPDGRTIVFSATRDGNFDLFSLDLETEEVTRLTDDDLYDGAPSFFPDSRSLVFTSVVGERAKLFRLDLDDPSKRYQLTFGESDDLDAVVSPDGERIYYTSDRDGFDNIYSLDLATGTIRKYTDVVTGCFMPTVLANPDGTETVVYTGFWNGRYRLYARDRDEPVEVVEETQVAEEATVPEDLPRYEPAIEVTLDDGNKEGYHGRKFFLEDAGTTIGVDDDQTLLGQVYLSFSDYLGDRRILAVVSSYDALSNFDVTYANLSHRFQWQARLFDTRDFYFVESFDAQAGGARVDRGELRFSGATASVIFPFSTYTRYELGAGYAYRKIQSPVFNQVTREFLGFNERQDDFPWLQSYLVGDSALYGAWGAPVSGRLWRVGANWAPDLDESGTLTSQATLDVRQYVALTRRTNFMFRLFGGAAYGNDPTLFYVGGTGTLRGFGYRRLVGDRTAFGTIEYRFPLIDVLATPALAFTGIRGRIFLDVGSVWFADDPNFKFYDSDENRLQDGVASYGLGFTVRFLGLDWSWDFAKLWDLKETQSGWQTNFFIGRRF